MVLEIIAYRVNYEIFYFIELGDDSNIIISTYNDYRIKIPYELSTMIDHYQYYDIEYRDFEGAYITLDAAYKLLFSDYEKYYKYLSSFDLFISICGSNGIGNFNDFIKKYNSIRIINWDIDTIKYINTIYGSYLLPLLYLPSKFIGDNNESKLFQIIKETKQNRSKILTSIEMMDEDLISEQSEEIVSSECI